jgi:glycosyltransferase involved in cell wall biosynthesis
VPPSRRLRLPSGRNTGLSHARGRTVAFLDDDDVFLPCNLATSPLPEQTAEYHRVPHATSMLGAVPDGAKVMARFSTLVRRLG